MIEPKRLLEDGATDFERQLLQSLAEDKPTAKHQVQMMKAVCITGPLLWGAQARAAVSATREVLVQSASVGATKAVIATAVVGGAGVAYWGQSGEATPPRATTSAAEVAIEAPAPSPDLPQQPKAALQDSLAREVQLLDAARSALKTGDRVSAQGYLREYSQQFPQGVLVQEAQFLQQRLEPGEQ